MRETGIKSLTAGGAKPPQQELIINRGKRQKRSSHDSDAVFWGEFESAGFLMRRLVY